AVSKSLILTLIGEKWLPTVVYLQLLCLVGMFYPLHSLNLNILQIHGRSDLFLKLEIFKKILAAPVILCGIFWGIKVMIIGMILNAMIETFLDSYWSGKFVGYSFSRQIRDILPSFFLAAVISLMIWPISLITAFPPFWVLTLQLSGLIFLTIGICEFLNFQEYQNIRNIIVEKLKSRS
ncbi:MAG: polysaccharide biosynthesis C-terminal domain-containing protein, partial [Bacteroidota bacterium]|nr:polysaccharide biosynthesis C-terminal domain-containing protein [Bacteroidota bacterium]